MDEHPPFDPRQQVRVAARDEQARIDLSTKHARWAAEDNRPRFNIYRSDSVSLTSTLFSGGDWHWRLMGPDGSVLVDCGGYTAEKDCREAAIALRDVAGQAFVPGLMADNP